jgi:hypothetical protein
VSGIVMVFQAVTDLKEEPTGLADALGHPGAARVERPDPADEAVGSDMSGNVTQPRLTCPHCHGEVSAANTHSAPGPGARPALAAAHP